MKYSPTHTEYESGDDEVVEMMLTGDEGMNELKGLPPSFYFILIILIKTEIN